DPDFGSGAVKITGAHDFNDYEVARRGDIPMYRLMDEIAAMRSDGAPYAEAANAARDLRDVGGTPDKAYVDTINLVPDEYRGLDRFEARKRVIADIDADGLMIMVEEKKVMQPFGDRSRVVIEPMLTDQWFCNAEELAKPAIAAVEDGRTTFVPKNWEKTYFEWMRNIQPWCISRQLWWGHQIPAWYTEDGEIFVAESEAEARAAAEKKHGGDVELTRDPDVLDTWFSSALWPFSTLGWPEETPELARYYPTSVLVTGFDIIFFWVARMMMFGMHFMKDDTGKPVVPFHDVYIHALVRDEDGQKMSKSEGNVIDPVDLIQGIDVDTLAHKRTTGLRQPEKAPQIDKSTRARYPQGFDAYGADALRFTLAIMAAMGRDIKLSVDRVAGYRNFGTKFWNASRFAQMNECAPSQDFDPASAQHVINRWIIGATAKTAGEVTRALDAYRYNDAADAIYRFTWHTFCDWYVELIKPLLNGSDEDAKAETRQTAAWALDHILKLLHPFMPFITEELWAKLAEHGSMRATPLMLSGWPTLDGLGDADAADEVDWVIALVTEIRSVRSEMNVPAGTKIPLELIDPSRDIMRRIDRHTDTIERLARLDGMTPVDKPSKGAAQIVVGETTMALPLAGIMDVGAEAERLRKEIAKQQSEIAKIDKKLSNAQFLEKAPDHVIAEQKSRQSDARTLVAKLEEALTRIEAMA
ncbi:MAG: valine--tRNA ligase, partial [Pseudomonadota bacterium]